VVARSFYNEQLFFLVTEGWKFDALIWYVVLACLVGLFSLYFNKAYYFNKKMFYKIKGPYQKVLVGGLLLGAMVFLFPTLYGEGYITIKNLLGGNYSNVITNSIFVEYSNIPWVIILFTTITLFAKSAATMITLGAGGNGGIFAPSLIMGGLIGFVLAFTINTLGIAHVNVANFIVAGMAASLSAIMHAPLTGIFLIAEITGGYVLMVPLMITSALAYLINRSKNKYSIYTKPLAEKGELMSLEDKDATVLHMMKLKYLVEKDYLLLNDTDSLAERMSEILTSKRNVFPVVAEDRTFKGMVYVEEVLRKGVNTTLAHDLTVHDFVQTAPDIVFIQDSLRVVLAKMEKENAWVLPVLNEQEEFLGFVSKTAVFNKYRALLSRQADYME